MQLFCSMREHLQNMSTDVTSTSSSHSHIPKRPHQLILHKQMERQALPNSELFDSRYDPNVGPMKP